VVCSSSPTSLTFPIRARQSLQLRLGGLKYKRDHPQPAFSVRAPMLACWTGFLCVADPCGHLQKSHCRRGATRFSQLDLDVAGTISSASMATLWLYRPCPRPWRPPPSPRALSRGAPLQPLGFSRSERAACASSRAREAGMRGVLAPCQGLEVGSHRIRVGLLAWPCWLEKMKILALLLQS
jgi:hypothetical protein